MYKVWQGGDHDPIWWTFLPSNIILLSELKEFPDDYLRAVEPEEPFHRELESLLQSFPKEERSPTHEGILISPIGRGS